MTKTKSEINEKYRKSLKGKQAIREAQGRYFKTEKGKQAKNRYIYSEKGKQALFKARKNYEIKQDERKPFGELLFEYRTNKGYSREEIAEKLGVTSRAVRAWESGARGIRLEIQGDLIEVLGEEYETALEDLKKQTNENIR